jgi:glycosyltransferase involved in cell wall biosynthesis
VERIPDMGSHTEIIFVDGNSTDGTPEAILKSIDQYQGQKDIKLICKVRGSERGTPSAKGSRPPAATC